jgi:hypothetical protein
MRYLFFTNTPAHVHLYRHAATSLERQGHEILVLARDYGCTEDLLSYYGLPYQIYGVCDTTKGSFFRSLPGHYASIFRKTLRYDPDLVFGIGGYAAHAGAVARTPAVLIHDSEPTTLDHLVSRPFASMILTPHAFQKDLGEKHYRFTGFKETAYLHPDVYEPEGDVRAQLGVDASEPYAIVRLNAFGSHHDVGHGGFTADQRRTLIERLSEHTTVFVSDEGGDLDLAGLDAQAFDVHPALMHDALAEATVVVADTQTVATEAALLGTPVIRSNSFVGDDDMGNFIELEAQDLIRNLETFDSVLDTAVEFARDDDVGRRWERRRRAYLGDLVNLTELITTLATEMDSARTLDRVLDTSLRGDPSSAT